jgi:hypothetical protein
VKLIIDVGVGTVVERLLRGSVYQAGRLRMRTARDADEDSAPQGDATDDSPHRR